MPLVLVRALNCTIWIWYPLLQLVLQLGHEKVNPIIRSFSTPVIGDKVDSACRDGKGYMLVRSASPQPSSVQQSRENESGDAVHPHVSSEFDVEKGEDIFFQKHLFIYLFVCLNVI